MWVSELLPWKAKMVDELCFIRSMHTEAINHEPAITYIQTGNQITGRPCLGAWASYGLGSLNNDLPTFVVLVAKPTNTEQVQAISARLWQAGYLPGEHAGVLVPLGGRSDSLYQQPARRARRRPPQNARRPQGPQRADLPADRRSRNADAHRAIRAGVPHAVERAGADRPSDETEATLDLYGDAVEKARHVRQHGPAHAAGWSSAACASCRFITTTGTRTPTSPAACPISAATSISPATAWCKTSSSAACSTRR